MRLLAICSCNSRRLSLSTRRRAMPCQPGSHSFVKGWMCDSAKGRWQGRDDTSIILFSSGRGRKSREQHRLGLIPFFFSFLLLDATQCIPQLANREITFWIPLDLLPFSFFTFCPFSSPFPRPEWQDCVNASRQCTYIYIPSAVFVFIFSYAGRGSCPVVMSLGDYGDTLNK